MALDLREFLTRLVGIPEARVEEVSIEGEGEPGPAVILRIREGRPRPPR